MAELLTGGCIHPENENIRTMHLIQYLRRLTDSRNFKTTFALVLLLAVSAGRLHAGLIYVPNASFETPVTASVDIRIDAWAQNPNFMAQATGLFANTPVTNSDHIFNMDGNQAAFLLNAPTIEVSQDYDAVDWSGATHLFDAKYEVSKAYDLTVGVIGGGGGMPAGQQLRVGLYYRDALSNKVVIASRTITNSPALFPNNTNLVDFTVHLPGVKVGDAWAGKHIGIQLLDTSAAPSPTGYWDVDNVRLRESVEPLNYSFETPVTATVDIRIDGWSQNPPFNFQATGLFANTPITNSDHIFNMDGNQAAFILNAPTVEVAQDYLAADWSGTSQLFQAKYEAGKAYTYTVGVIGGGGGMPAGQKLQLGFYYRDAASNKVVIAAYTITNSPALFPNNTNLVDFSVQLPGVKPTDAWAGKYLGLQLLDTSASPSPTGYWDVDYARVALARAPMILNGASGNGQFQFTVNSEPGLKFDVLASTNITLPRSNWTSLGTVTNTTGANIFTDAAAQVRRYYQLHQLP